MESLESAAKFIMFVSFFGSVFLSIFASVYDSHASAGGASWELCGQQRQMCVYFICDTARMMFSVKNQKQSVNAPGIAGVDAPGGST